MRLVKSIAGWCSHIFFFCRMKNFQGEGKQEEEVTSHNQFDALIVKPIVIGY